MVSPNIMAQFCATAQGMGLKSDATSEVTPTTQPNGMGAGI